MQWWRQEVTVLVLYLTGKWKQSGPNLAVAARELSSVKLSNPWNNKQVGRNRTKQEKVETVIELSCRVRFE